MLGYENRARLRLVRTSARRDRDAARRAPPPGERSRARCALACPTSLAIRLSGSGDSDVPGLRRGNGSNEWGGGPRTGSGENVQVGSVMRIHRRKRPLALVHAAAGVLRKHPRARLTLVGEGPLRFAVEREVW